jgi:hypothetical protein
MNLTEKLNDAVFTQLHRCLYWKTMRMVGAQPRGYAGYPVCSCINVSQTLQISRGTKKVR